MPYFDNAATSLPKPAAVSEAVQTALQTFGNPSRSAHAEAMAAGHMLAEARDEIAAFFGCRNAERVVFTKNVTEALNIAIQGLDGHIVTSEAEHNSVLRPVHHKGDYTFTRVDEKGRVHTGAIKKAVTPKTVAIVLAHASNLTGNPVPVGDIGAFCRENGLLFIVDAAQTAGLYPIDMEALCIDALCFTGHKSLYGPQGTGGLCLGERYDPRPLMQGGSGSRSFELEHPDFLPDRLEAGTLNGHGIAGLLAGVRYLREKGQAPLKEARRLEKLFYGLVAEIPGIELYGDYEMQGRAPIVSLNLEGYSSGELAAVLSDEYEIAVRSGIHCAPLLHRRFGTEKRGAVRFSFSHFNTEQEVRLGAQALRALV
ncbi:aminotransferase class V-fold PLP-dependent enzyme [Ruminococcaceae bacterium OttesenSCG-928-I18]|nr:aminotransferase class V-fold PLP-dependent enzyme [Ruminococcaceae bacterium OttesenSCG-928-I18]